MVAYVTYLIKKTSVTLIMKKQRISRRLTRIHAYRISCWTGQRSILCHLVNIGLMMMRLRLKNRHIVFVKRFYGLCGSMADLLCQTKIVESTFNQLVFVDKNNTIE